MIDNSTPAGIDPGNEVSKPKPHTLEWVCDFVRRHPGATTGQGEADLLVKEIDTLRAQLAADQSYSGLERELESLPTTWIPALFRIMIRRAILAGVFIPGGLEQFVKNTLENAGGV